MVVVCLGAQLDFLDFNRLLLLARFAFSPLPFILKLAEIHNTAHRRIGIGRNLYQIQPFGPGQFQRIARVYNTNIIIGIGNHADFADTNILIDAKIWGAYTVSSSLVKLSALIDDVGSVRQKMRTQAQFGAIIAYTTKKVQGPS